MNETNFDPTFADDKFEYEDLNVAHESDVGDGSNPEEDVYPDIKFTPDTKAQDTSREEIEQKRKIETWEANKELHLSNISKSTTIAMLNWYLEFAQDEANSGQLGDQQLAEIVQAGEARRAEIWEANKNSQLSFIISKSTTMVGLNRYLEFAQDQAKSGQLGDQQLAEIVQAGEAKRAEIWEANKEFHLSYISKSTTIAMLNRYLEFAQDEANSGQLGDQQLAEIVQAGEARRKAFEVAAEISG